MSTQMMPWKHNLAMIEAISPSLRYKDGEDFAEWQSEARKKLAELLGLHNIKKPNAPAFDVEYVKEGDNVTEYRLRIQSEEGYSLPAIMLVPRDRKKKMPVALCVQGQTSFQELYADQHTLVAHTKFHHLLYIAKVSLQ